MLLQHAAPLDKEKREWDLCWLWQQLREGGFEDAPLPQTGKKHHHHLLGTPTAKKPHGAPGYFSTNFCQATQSPLKRLRQPSINTKSSLGPFCSPPRSSSPISSLYKAPRPRPQWQSPFFKPPDHSNTPRRIQRAGQAPRFGYKHCLQVQQHSCEYLKCTNRWLITRRKQDLQWLFTAETSPGLSVCQAFLLKTWVIFLPTTGAFWGHIQRTWPDNSHRGWCRGEVRASPVRKRLDWQTRISQLTW